MLTEPYSAIRSSTQSLGPAKSLDYAVAFRFEVLLGGINTGDWTSCSGLKVDFKPEQLRSGGRYAATRWMPGEATYPRVVLRRAIDPKGSRGVQDWLAKHAWQSLSKALDSNDALTGTIVLYDADNDPVMRWELHGVHPAAWNGPDLDAAAGKVALETLELVHSGFEVQVVKGGAPAGVADDGGAKTGTADQLALLSISAGKGHYPLGTVSFLHNPDSVTVRYAPAAGTEFSAPAGSGPGNSEGGPLSANTTPPGLSYTFAGLQLVEVQGVAVATAPRRAVWDPRPATAGRRPGPTETAARLLLDWAKGWKETVQDSKGKDKTIDKAIQVVVSWGEFFKDKPMKIHDVQIAYTRFLPDGRPIRAKISTLVLREWTPEGKIANPSSGGVSGRRTHRLIQGESLATIAQDIYGSGGSWRAIAEANDIDDPARIRPGTLLYLPASVELPGPGRD